MNNHPTNTGTNALHLLIVTFDPPENVGGVEGRTHGYVRELSKSGCYVEVEALSPSYDFAAVEFEGSILHQTSSRLVLLPSSFARTRRLIIDHKLDSVFLLTGGFTMFGLALLAYCRLTGKRTTMLVYGKDILQARRKPLGRILARFSPMTARCVSANSRYTASLLPRTTRTKARILYPAVDPRIAVNLIPSKRTDSERTILFVGRLVKRKGVEDLLAATKTLLRDFPQLRLEIVGDGPERGRLDALVSSLGLEGAVTFFGSLRGKPLMARYQLCDVFAMPSRTLKDDIEGFGTVFLEAGLFGKPCVGTFSGGIPDAILDGMTGLLVKEGDQKQLADALRTVLSDKALATRLGTCARERVLSHFTWEETTKQLVQIISL